MNAKEALLRDKELAKWLVSVTHDPRWENVEIIVRAYLADTAPSWEELKGGNAALSLLTSITDNDPTSPSLPTPGLDKRNLTEIMEDVRKTTSEPPKPL
jgi:hypothetical protein